MRKTQITLIAVLLAAGAGYSALLTQDFEGQAAGSQPTGTAYLRPTANSSTQAVQVFSSTLLGGSNAVQYLDRAVNTATSSALAYNFVSNGAVMLSFSFSPSYTNGSSANYLSAGLSQQVVINSTTLLFGEARMYGNGLFRFYSGASLAYSTNLTVNSSNTVSMYVNDTSSDIIYAGGTRTNLANTVDYYLNGSLAYAGASFGTSASALGTTNGMGRVVFFDGTARTDLDYLFDNITVEAIPEPATLGMLVLGALTVLAVRRHPGRLGRRD